MGNRNEELEQVYSNESYVWDGKERPVLSNYTAPWTYYASQQPSTVLSRRQIQAIDYAKLKLQEATKQFEQDLSYWNEQDERSYTSPISQTQRYGDAGYNMGYLYGNVDSGNSAVGYNQESTSIDTDTSDAYEKVFDSVVSLVTGSAELLSDLVKKGYEVNRVAKMTPWQVANLVAEGQLKSFDLNFKDFLATTSTDGEAMGEKYLDKDKISVLFAQTLSRVTGQDLSNKQTSTFLNYYEKILQKESTPDAINSLNQYIDSQDLGDGLKALLKILAAAATK